MKFSGFSMFARLAAVAIASAAVLDPVLTLPRTERPPIRVIATADADTAAVSAALKHAGFAVNAAEPEAARLIVGDRPPEQALSTEPQALSTEHRALSTHSSSRSL